MPRFVIFVLVLLTFSTLVVAQVQSSGSCDLSVHVVTGDEHSIETQIQVQLFTSQSVLATVSIVGDESAQFRVSVGPVQSGGPALRCDPSVHASGFTRGRRGSVPTLLVQGRTRVGDRTQK